MPNHLFHDIAGSAWLLLLVGQTMVFCGPSDAPISFEPNCGQTAAQVRYLAHTPQGVAFFTDTGVVLNSLTWTLAGSNTRAVWKPSEPTGDTTTYHVGRDPRRWANDVPHYARLVRGNVYPGIDAAYYGTGRRLEYDFLVAPGADPKRIRIHLRGAQRISLTSEGDLLISTASGEIREYKPAIYQTASSDSHTPVDGGYRLLSRNEVGFTLGAYDHSKPLAIDPVLESSTYLGGDGEDQVIYSAGAVAAGNTSSIDFPDSTPARRKGWDVFYRSGNSTQIFGGSGDDVLTAVLSTYYTPTPILAGYTNSTDLPTSPDAFQPNYAGGASDGFLIFFGTSSQPYYHLGPVISYYGTPGDDRITAGTGPYTSGALTGWTTSRGLVSGSWTGTFGTFVAIPPLVQYGSGGGVDGFVVNYSYSPGGGGVNSFSIGNVLYFGGSGDDRPATMSASPYNAASGYIVAGETTSTDFPNLVAASGPRRGDSDAFIMLAPLSGTPSAVLFGGSGADRATGIAVLTDGSIAIAGTTNSADLPLVKADQSSFGGGASDVFAAIMAADLSRTLYATYWGGSAQEEATSVTADPAGGWYIGGWTASSDFPVSNAVQSSFGGGADDGFLLHYDPEGKIHQSTFLGGAGSDRVLGINSVSPFQVTLSGQTTSADFPATATQSIRGGSDGFSAVVSTNLIGVRRVFGSSGFRASAGFSSRAGTFTLTTSDPASVLLADTETGPNQASITLASSGSPGYYVDCLWNGVGADITVSAPGYASKAVRVDCVPPSITYGISLQNATLSDGVVHTSAWSGPVGVNLYLYAPDPAGSLTGNLVFAKTDADRVPVQVQVSDPSVAGVSPSSALIGRSAFPSSSDISVSPLKVGLTDLVFSSPRLQIRDSDRIHFSVDVPFNATVPQPIPGGFQVPYSLRLSGPAPAGTTITVTSGDPNRLVVTENRSQPGGASADYRSSGVYLQALATSGQVPLTVTITGFDPVMVPVTLTSPTLNAYSSLLTSPTLAPGQTASVGANFGVNALPNPQGSAPRLTLTSSDSQVLQVAEAFVDLNINGSANFQVKGVAVGSANLTLTSNNGAPPPASVNPLRVNVAKPSIQLHDFELGKDLSTGISLLAPPGAPSNVSYTVSISDPSAAVVGLSNTGQGQAQVSGNASDGVVAFYVFGLAGSGSARITLNIAGYDPASATVTLVPSGIGWTAESLSSNLYTATQTANLASYALDPATLVPIALQSPRPGISVTIQIQSDHPEVVVPTSATIALPAAASVTLQNTGTGSAQLTLTQPSGFTTPASRQRLSYRVDKTGLYFSLSGPIGIHTQQQAGLDNIPAAFQKTATITSSDPSKLVLSASQDVLGSGSLSMKAGTRFFVQALDNRGPVSLTARLDGFDDTTFPIQLTGTGAVLYVTDAQQGPFNGGGSFVKQNEAYTTLSSGTTQISVYLALVNPDTGEGTYNGGITLRPGIDPSIAVTSANPSVGTIQSSPIRAPGTVSFQPVGLGDTEVRAIPPPGFTAAAGGRVVFHVEPPGWDIGQPGAIGKDTIQQLPVRLAGNVKPFSTNVPITITSGDPSRLLLSRDAATPGSPSITMTLIAGQTSAGAFYAQALDNRGTAPVTITAPGFADTTFSMALTDTLFGIQLFQRMILQQGAQKGTVFAGAANGGSSGIRPGASITVHIESSDPSVLAVDTPDINMSPGDVTTQFSVRPVNPGKATIRVIPPSGYGTFDVGYYASSVEVTVDPVRLTFDPVGSVGKDLQGQSSAGFEPGAQVSSLTYTVTSSDPSRLLISSSATTSGSAQVTLQGTNVPVYLQALANSGSVDVTVSAPGAQSATATIPLGPSAVVFDWGANTLDMQVNGTSQQLQVALKPLDRATLQPTCCQNPRPGWSASVGVTSSDPSVVSVSPSTVLLPGSSTSLVTLTPGKAGTAIVSLPIVNDTPASGRQIVVNVR
jgi:hypothetical protein